MDASAAFWDLLAFTTGITYLDKETMQELKTKIKRPSVATDGNDEYFDDMDGDGLDDRYESMTTDLEDPSWQMMEIAQFTREQSNLRSMSPVSPTGKNKRRPKVSKISTKDDKQWSPQVQGLLHLYKKNLALENPKLWKKSKYCNFFKSMKLKALNISNFDVAFKEFKRLDELNISQNKVTTLRNLPPRLRVLYAFHNEVSRIDTNVSHPKLECLGLGCNNLAQVNDIVLCFPDLQILDLSYNQLIDIDDIVNQLAKLPNLKNLTLLGNPCALLPGYLNAVVSKLPTLEYLDDLTVEDIKQYAPTPDFLPLTTEIFPEINRREIVGQPESSMSGSTEQPLTNENNKDNPMNQNDEGLPHSTTTTPVVQQCDDNSTKIKVDRNIVELKLSVERFYRTTEAAALKRELSKSKYNTPESSLSLSPVPSTKSNDGATSTTFNLESLGARPADDSQLKRAGKDIHSFSIKVELAGKILEANEITLPLGEDANIVERPEGLDQIVQYTPTTQLRDALAVDGLKCTLYCNYMPKPDSESEKKRKKDWLIKNELLKEDAPIKDSTETRNSEEEQGQEQEENMENEATFSGNTETETTLADDPSDGKLHSEPNTTTSNISSITEADFPPPSMEVKRVGGSFNLDISHLLHPWADKTPLVAGGPCTIKAKSRWSVLSSKVKGGVWGMIDKKSKSPAYDIVISVELNPRIYYSNASASLSEEPKNQEKEEEEIPNQSE